MNDQETQVYGIKNLDTAILTCQNYIDRVKAYNFNHFVKDPQTQSLIDRVLNFKSKGKKK